MQFKIKPHKNIKIEVRARVTPPSPTSPNYYATRHTYLSPQDLAYSAEYAIRHLPSKLFQNTPLVHVRGVNAYCQE